MRKIQRLMEHRHIGTTVLYCDVRGIPSSWFEGTSFTGDGQGIENRAFEKPVPSTRVGCRKGTRAASSVRTHRRPCYQHLRRIASTKPIDFGTLRSEIDMRVERAA